MTYFVKHFQNVLRKFIYIIDSNFKLSAVHVKMFSTFIYNRRLTFEFNFNSLVNLVRKVIYNIYIYIHHSTSDINVITENSTSPFRIKTFYHNYAKHFISISLWQFIFFEVFPSLFRYATDDGFFIHFDINTKQIHFNSVTSTNQGKYFYHRPSFLFNAANVKAMKLSYY